MQQHSWIEFSKEKNNADYIIHLQTFDMIIVSLCISSTDAHVNFWTDSSSKSMTYLEPCTASLVSWETEGSLG